MADQRTAQLADFFRRKGSPLVPYAQDFVNVADQYGLDYRILPAISGIETQFGKTGVGVTGPFGYGSATSYGNPRRAIQIAGKALGANADTSGMRAYYKNAKTIPEIARIWAPVGASNDPNGTNGGWPSAVSQFFRELGGNPSAAVRGLGPGGAGLASSDLSAAATDAASGAPKGIATISLPDPAAMQKWLKESENWALGGTTSPKRTFMSYADEQAEQNKEKPKEPDFSALYGTLTKNMGQMASTATTPQETFTDVTALPEGAVDSGKVVRGGEGGNWGGSLPIALQLQRLSGITPSSQKRSRRLSASGHPSDHWEGSTTSYAIDLPGRPGDGRTDAAASRIVKALGGPDNWGATGGAYNGKIGNYRVQVLWKTNTGGNHYDHIHIGVRRQ